MSTGHHADEEEYLYMPTVSSDDEDDDGDHGTNSTCAQYTSCTDCLDFYDREAGEGCLWCRVPVSDDTNIGPVESGGGNGGGLCLQRSKAQNRCEIGELQVRERAYIALFVLLFNAAGYYRCSDDIQYSSTSQCVRGQTSSSYMPRERE